MAEPNEAATETPRTLGERSRTSARIGRFLRDAGGGTAIEYAMIGALVFAVAAGSIRIYGSKLTAVYGRIGSAMAQID